MEEIRLYNHFNNDGSCNMTLLFDSTRALARFRALSTHVVHRDGEATRPENSADVVPLEYLFETILTIHEQMNEESLEFIGKLFNRATDIVYTRLQTQNCAHAYDASGCTQP